MITGGRKVREAADIEPAARHHNIPSIRKEPKVMKAFLKRDIEGLEPGRAKGGAFILVPEGNKKEKEELKRQYVRISR